MTTHSTRGRRKRIAAATAVVAALLATAACGGGGDDDGGKGKGKAAGFDAANNKVANASTKKGGTLKFAGAQDADSWDTTRAYYGFAWNFQRYYSRQLVTGKTEPGKSGTELTPDLATARAQISQSASGWRGRSWSLPTVTSRSRAETMPLVTVP
ncbi:hypothetical protein ACWD6I_16180, partial [Streptomyces sp. NPDC002454]